MVMILDRLQTIGASLRGSATTLATDQAGQTFTPTPDRYTLAERYYANEAYSTRGLTGSVKGAEGLPRDLRPVFSLVKPAIDWWPDSIFGGTMTHDGKPTSDGVPNRIPYDADTPEDLRLAVQQAFAWGNWDSEILTYVHFGVLLGDVFAEVEIDYERRKVYPVLWHPRHVTNIEWNRSGDVTMYQLAVDRIDDGVSYTWGKKVERDTITTLKDGKPFDYDGEGATRPNPWGFVPGVWVMHKNVGGQHGAGIIDTLWPILDGVQGAGGAIYDYIHKFVRQHVLIETTDTAGAKRTTDASVKRGATEDFVTANANADRESQGVRFVPPGTKVHRIIENIGLGDAEPHMLRLMANIDTNLPELSIERKLAESSQLTGPGATRIVAPLQRRVNDSFGNYARGVIDLGQMCVSIMGELVNTIWRSDLDRQMQKFRPFTLKSYAAGDLDYSLRTPLLVRPTMLELATEAAAIERLTTAHGLAYLGLSPTDIYGAGNEPDAPLGILVERQQARADAEFAASTIFNSGQ